jgi:LysM repeat protein
MIKDSVIIPPMFIRIGALTGFKLAGIFLVFFASACQSSSSTDSTVTPNPVSIPLTPYLTSTPSMLPPTNSNRAILTPTLAPSPTPTPLTHSVIEGDTMLAIAFQYGISLEELLAANPDVDPRLISVGTELIIPFGESSPPIFATATPLPIPIQPAVCYPDAVQGVWCFILVSNDRSRAVENLTAKIFLLDSEGSIVEEGLAFAPLNFILPEQKLPLTVYFGGPVQGDFSSQVELTSVLPVPRDDERYLNAWVEIDNVEIAPDGEVATVSGEVGLPTRSQPAAVIWLAAVAYDESGDVSAVRKLEMDGSLEPGTERFFEISLYSLGPVIERVEVSVEARP